MSKGKHQAPRMSNEVVGLISNVCSFCRVWIHANRMRADYSQKRYYGE